MSETKTPVAAKADNKSKTEPVIPAPKSMRGKKGTVGAPRKPIIGLSTHRVRGAFTIGKIYALNARTIAELTIRNRIEKMIEAGELVKKAEKAVIKGRVGKPADLFIFASAIKNRPNAEEIPTVAVETAPFVDANQGIAAPGEVEQVPEHAL